MLTLDKAIEIQAQYLKQKPTHISNDLDDALNLTLEASKRFKALREVIRVPYTELLPGEDPQ